MTISSPVYSFVDFNGTVPPAGCCIGEEDFCLPIQADGDLYFQVKIEAEDFPESLFLQFLPSDGINLLALRGTGNTVDTYGENTFIDFNSIGNHFEKYRVSLTEFVFVWRNALTGLLDNLECGECFQLAIDTRINDNHVTLFSNCMKRVCDDCYTSVLEYGNNDDGFGFRYCNIEEGFKNRVRLPFHFSRPQITDDETVYPLSDGTIKLLKSVSKKTYQAKTYGLSEFFHDKLKVALSHDVTNIESSLYTGGFRKDGAYNIGWDDELNLCTAPADFKASVSPYAVRNSNCEDCEEVDVPVICPDIEAVSLSSTLL